MRRDVERSAKTSTSGAPWRAPARARCRGCRTSARTSHRHLGDTQGGLAGAHGHALAVLAADTGLHVEVGGDHVDAHEDVDAVADERGAAQRRGDAAVLDEIALGDAEDEVAAGRLYLPAGQALGVEATRRRRVASTPRA